MGKFIGGTRFSNADLEAARNMSTVDVISSRTGYTFRREGSEWHCKEHDSLVVFSDGKGWKWYSRLEQGEPLKGNNAIAFLMKVEGLSFQDSVAELVTPSGRVYSPVKEEQKIEKPKSLQLPPSANDFSQVINYLQKQRGIDPIIIKHCINYGMLYQDQRNNCVFVGRDESGTPRYASRRGTYTPPGKDPFKRDCAGSNKMYGFLMQGSCKEHIFVFEAPIDVLSHATLTMEKAHGMERSDWRTSWIKHSRLALGGTSDNALARYLIVHPEVKQISLCLDNDEAGQTHAAAYKEKYEKEGYTVNIYKVPPGMGKDYNDYLLKFKQEKHTRQQIMSQCVQNSNASTRTH